MESRSSTLTPGLRKEYQGLWDTAVIKPDRISEIDGIIRRILGNNNATRKRYETVSAKTGIPWYFIAGLHNLEASLNFKTHLHNGDPLAEKTVQVPANRPENWYELPPEQRTWENSAVDALSELDKLTDWSIPGIGFAAERYNGWGYRNHGVWTPYLWSMTNHYQSGKYVSDGAAGWSATAVSVQCGIMALMKRMNETGVIVLSPSAEPQPTAPPATTAPAPVPTAVPRLAYPGQPIRKDSPLTAAVTAIQQRLNDLGLGPLAVDGVFGNGTERVVRQFQTSAKDHNGRPLAVDGVVGPLSWSALFG